MKEKCVLAVAIEARTKMAPRVQEVLTRYGDAIHMRCGYHGEGGYENDGLIVLQMADDVSKSKALKDELGRLEGVRVNMMLV